MAGTLTPEDFGSPTSFPSPATPPIIPNSGTRRDFSHLCDVMHSICLRTYKIIAMYIEHAIVFWANNTLNALV